ncbi:MAG TPA: NAD(P)/FAD-dependent oxidoreductase [Steroidobacteraceae bacterium]|nr:NAD(P)/FAD-dependent oxidoreductase [Steroidobacteraceae bacterium]
MDVHTVVVGAGVVGLAVARARAMAGHEVVVLERERAIGTATSSRNSGVIHAGLYYSPSSLKAALCVRGKELLYEFCARRGVSHARCGKLIVASTDGETPRLGEYEALGRANGAGALDWLSPAEVVALEPEVRCVAALHSLTTGIVDVHELMSALAADIASSGGHVVLDSELARAEPIAAGFELWVNDGYSTRLKCRELINAAGLEAPAVAARIAGLAPSTLPTARFARGRYYALRGPPPFRRLIYPVADTHSLGIHATLDLAGRVRFGPDVEWIECVDYRFDESSSAQFAAAIRRYYPSLDASRLQPDYTGIRPKIYARGEPAADFRIDGPAAHGLEGLVNLFGIESPGLTAALAIAEKAAQSLGG